MVSVLISCNNIWADLKYRGGSFYSDKDFK